MWAQAPVPVIDARQSACTNRQTRCPDDRTPILNFLPRPGAFCHITGNILPGGTDQLNGHRPGARPTPTRPPSFMYAPL
jgi:hypothetical protein